MKFFPYVRSKSEHPGMRVSLLCDTNSEVSIDINRHSIDLLRQLKKKKMLHYTLLCKFECTVEPVLKDHHVGHTNVVCQDRWSLVTGSVY